MMTVADLIARLQQLPGDLPVMIVEDVGFYNAEIDTQRVIRVANTPYYIEADDADGYSTEGETRSAVLMIRDDWCSE